MIYCRESTVHKSNVTGSGFK